MCELKDYLLGRMMFDPSRNASETIETFLRGYYGEAAAPHVLRYLEIMHVSAHNHSYHMVSARFGYLDAESRCSDCR